MADAAGTQGNRLVVSFIGFGEAAGAFVSGWAGSAPADIAAYDIKTDAAGPVRDAKVADYAAAGVTGRATSAEAVAGADVVFSLVTADQALAAAEAAARGINGPALFFDCNSCAPETKRRSAALIDAAGGRYVDVAVMAPVHPKRHRTPVLVSGPHAPAALEVMAALDMAAEHAPGDVGTASAIKLCRSVMVKGLEALSAEFMLVARSFGVEDEVIASLDASHPGFGWRGRIAHSLERMVVHGRRRAAEMQEAANMVEDAGLPGRMARATAEWQAQVGEMGLKAEDDAVAQADALLKALGVGKR